MKNLSEPKNKTAKFLKALIEGKEVSIKTFGESSMRSRISDLRNIHLMSIESLMIDAKNEFGNAYQYASYKLRSPKGAARKLYIILNK